MLPSLRPHTATPTITVCVQCALLTGDKMALLRLISFFWATLGRDLRRRCGTTRTLWWDTLLRAKNLAASRTRHVCHIVSSTVVQGLFISPFVVSVHKASIVSVRRNSSGAFIATEESVVEQRVPLLDTKVWPRVGTGRIQMLPNRPPLQLCEGFCTNMIVYAIPAHKIDGVREHKAKVDGHS